MSSSHACWTASDRKYDFTTSPLFGRGLRDEKRRANQFIIGDLQLVSFVVTAEGGKELLVAKQLAQGLEQKRPLLVTIARTGTNCDTRARRGWPPYPRRQMCDRACRLRHCSSKHRRACASPCASR